MSASSSGESPDVSASRLRDAVIRRQLEMNELNEYRFRTLENQSREKDALLSDERRKLESLKNDFAYNLSLLEGRDDELRRYDDTFEQLKRVISEKDELLSSSKSLTHDLEDRLKTEQQRSNDLEIYYQEKLESLKSEYRRRSETTRLQLQQNIQEYDDLITQLKTQLTVLRSDSDRTVALAREQKDTEIEQVKSTLSGTESRLVDALSRIQQLESDRSNTDRIHSSKTSLLTSQIDRLESQLQAERDTSDKRLSEQANASASREADLEKSFEARLIQLDTQLTQLASDNQMLQTHLEESQTQLRTAAHTHASTLRSLRSDIELQFYQKDREIESLKRERDVSGERVRVLEAQVGEEVGERQRVVGERDRLVGELTDVRESEVSLKTELLKLREMGSNRERSSRSRFRSEEEIEEERRQMSQMSQMRAEVREKDTQIGELREKLRDLETKMIQMESVHKRAEIQREIDEELGFSTLQPPSPVQSIPDQNELFADPRSPQAPARYQQQPAPPQVDQTQNRREMEELKLRNAILEDENRRVRDENATLKRMSIMAETAPPAHAPPPTTQPPDADLVLEVADLKRELAESKLAEQKARTEVLQQQSRVLDVGVERSRIKDQIVEDLRSEFLVHQSDLGSVVDSSQLSELNSLVTDLRVDFQHERQKLKTTKSNLVSARSENEELKTKLHDAARDLKKILRQREKLINLNNMYKSELSVLQSKMQGRRLSSDQIRRASTSVRKQAQEVSRLTTIVHELTSSNAALRKELHRISHQQSLVRDELTSGIDPEPPDDTASDTSERPSSARDTLRKVRNSLMGMTTLGGAKMPLHDRRRSSQMGDRTRRRKKLR